MKANFYSSSTGLDVRKFLQDRGVVSNGLLISECELVPVNHLEKRAAYEEEEERSLPPVSHHGGLAIESIKWSDLDPHSKESKKRDIGKEDILKNEMDFECDSIIDNSLG